MIKKINVDEFINEFKTYNMHNFSREGLRALFDYIEQVEDSTGESIELDVIALRCEYSQYQDISEAYDTYSVKENSKELSYEQMLEWLQDRTQVIELDGGIIIQNF